MPSFINIKPRNENNFGLLFSLFSGGSKIYNMKQRHEPEHALISGILAKLFFDVCLSQNVHMNMRPHCRRGNVALNVIFAHGHIR